MSTTVMDMLRQTLEGSRKKLAADRAAELRRAVGGSENIKIASDAQVKTPDSEWEKVASACDWMADNLHEVVDTRSPREKLAELHALQQKLAAMADEPQGLHQTTKSPDAIPMDPPMGDGLAPGAPGSNLAISEADQGGESLDANSSGSASETPPMNVEPSEANNGGAPTALGTNHMNPPGAGDSAPEKIAMAKIAMIQKMAQRGEIDVETANRLIKEAGLKDRIVKGIRRVGRATMSHKSRSKISDKAFRAAEDKMGRVKALSSGAGEKAIGKSEFKRGVGVIGGGVGIAGAAGYGGKKLYDRKKKNDAEKVAAYKAVWLNKLASEGRISPDTAQSLTKKANIGRFLKNPMVVDGLIGSLSGGAAGGLGRDPYDDFSGQGAIQGALAGAAVGAALGAVNKASNPFPLIGTPLSAGAAALAGGSAGKAFSSPDLVKDRHRESIADREMLEELDEIDDRHYDEINNLGWWSRNFGSKDRKELDKKQNKELDEFDRKHMKAFEDRKSKALEGRMAKQANSVPMASGTEAGEGTPPGPSDSNRSHVQSVTAAINATKRDLKHSQVKGEMARYLNQPAMSVSNDSVLQTQLDNASSAGVKIAAVKALLEKWASESPDNQGYLAQAISRVKMANEMGQPPAQAAAPGGMGGAPAAPPPKPMPGAAQPGGLAAPMPGADMPPDPMGGGEEGSPDAALMAAASGVTPEELLAAHALLQNSGGEEMAAPPAPAPAGMGEEEAPAGGMGAEQ